MYQDRSDEEYGRDSGSRTYMIFARTPTEYGEGGSGGAGYTDIAAYSRSGGVQSQGGGAGTSSGGMGGSLYQDYNQSYGYSGHDYTYEDGGAKPVSVVFVNEATDIYRPSPSIVICNGSFHERNIAINETFASQIAGHPYICYIM